MRTSRAAVITAHHKPLTIQSVPIPELEPGALLVSITASTLCGTDIHRWHGPLGGGDSLPIITGHEPCGIIQEINGSRTDILGNPVKPGDRIVWSYVACGSCYYCSVAAAALHLPRPRLLGPQPRRPVPVPARLGVGVHVRAAAVPDHQGARQRVLRHRRGLSACAYRTIMHGFDRLGAVKAHETIVIQGSGPLGTFAAAVAKDNGAKQVLMIGAPRQPPRRRRRMGADDASTSSDEDPRSAASG